LVVTGRSAPGQSTPGWIHIEALFVSFVSDCTWNRTEPLRSHSSLTVTLRSIYSATKQKTEPLCSRLPNTEQSGSVPRIRDRMAPFYLAPQPNTTLASSNSPRHRETLSSAERTYSAASSEVADIDDDDRTGYTFTTSAGFLIELRRPIRMNKKKRRRRRQQQGGRPVLVTFYVTQPRDRGGSTASSSSHHHHHNRQERHDDHHRRSHGGSGGRPGMQRRRRNDGKAQSGDRRADLLEYSRQLRALARQTASATTPVSSIPPPPPPRCRDTDTIMVRYWSVPRTLRLPVVYTRTHVPTR
jgi:hypothetical protein